MHVAIDGRLADYTTGGIAQYTLQLARALPQVGTTHRFTLLRARRPRIWPPAVLELKATRFLTPPHHKWEQVALPFELLGVRPDVLHSTDFIPPFRRWFRSVITVHDLGFLHFPDTLTPESRRYYGQIARAVRSADRVIAVSSSTRNDLIRLVSCDPARIDVVHEAADPTYRPVRCEAALETARRRLGISRPFVLFIGTFEPRKNLITLLEAFTRLRSEVDVQLALVGRRGWLDEPIFRRLSEPDLAPHVKVVEGRPATEFPAFYSAASVLVLPSLYEGFGLPVLEAMACGCPVVTSDRASLPEVVGEAGLLAPADDPIALADALARVLTDAALRADLVERGLTRAQQFSWRRAARETLAIYQKALA